MAVGDRCCKRDKLMTLSVILITIIRKCHQLKVANNVTNINLTKVINQKNDGNYETWLGKPRHHRFRHQYH